MGPRSRLVFISFNYTTTFPSEFTGETQDSTSTYLNKTVKDLHGIIFWEFFMSEFCPRGGRIRTTLQGVLLESKVRSREWNS